MSRVLGCLIAGAVLTVAGSAGASVVVNHPFTLAGGVGTRSSTSVAAVDASPEIDWTYNVTSVTVSGLLVGPISIPVTIPLTDPNYGVSAADLVSNGKLAGQPPSTVFSRRFTLVELGQVIPTYDFTLSLAITNDRKLQPTVVVHALTQFNPMGVTNSPFATPLTSLTVSGTATGSAVPAPAAAAPLAGLGLVAARRRRR